MGEDGAAECGKPVVVPSASDRKGDLRETIPAPLKTNEPKLFGSEILFECRKCRQSIAADVDAATRSQRYQASLLSRAFALHIMDLLQHIVHCNQGP